MQRIEDSSVLSLKLTILYDLYIRVFRRNVVDQNGLKTSNIWEGVRIKGNRRFSQFVRVAIFYSI